VIVRAALWIFAGVLIGIAAVMVASA